MEPWKTAYFNFSADTFSSSEYQMKGPHPVICRGGCSNYTSFSFDARAAWQNALMWYITRNQSHWDRATTILDAWGSNLTDVIGVDTALLVSLDGDLFVNAAEIMRWEGGWVEAGAKWSGGGGFSNQLYWLFARQAIIIGQANYGLATIKALLSFAVYLDDISMYNYALAAYQHDPCGGLLGNYDQTTGQGAETGRDQGHAMTSLGWAAEAARVMQSQGWKDSYTILDTLLLKGAEYAARFNLGYDVPYDRSFYRCEAILVNGPWAQPSNISRGIAGSPKVWDILYYQYNIKRGLNTPYIEQAKATSDAAGGEQHPGSASASTTDHPGWGDLIWAYPGKGSFLNNNDRTIWGGGSIGPNGTGNINAK
ncbi:hypothetical protein J7T55_007856 [Diaporthe amygdali]|uniref:uncharacterized protein n=1 Tax=Phomopsis amygdali TaxID=1214568 RepID=UPI0022FDBBC7|nr:uncharacterized protein J7T55_007856 [Diaporthe amygdali]KAJ0114022.1 hypothetical protein J7T55_007856 [Diaporthe amygdali]